MVKKYIAFVIRKEEDSKFYIKQFSLYEQKKKTNSLCYKNQYFFKCTN